MAIDVGCTCSLSSFYTSSLEHNPTIRRFFIGDKKCKIPQTKEAVGLREVARGKRYLFPIRIKDGIDYKSHNEVAEMKKGILKDNFFFAKHIVDFAYYG